MTIFELVKVALDELYQEGKKTYGAKLDDHISHQMSYLAQSYGQLNKKNRVPVNYKDPATRFAYVYMYVAAHGDYVVQVLEKLRNKLGSTIFSGDVARVSCIGGGPGSDIIAVLKYLDEYKNEPTKKVTCYLLDKEQAWADTWTELDDSLQLKGLVLHANFQPLDVTDQESWLSQKKFLQGDLFTMSYFVSEVMSLDHTGIVSNFWSTIFNEAKSGALFLYDDNGHVDFNKYFDELWKSSSLECLISEDNVIWTPRYSEQASELGDYRTKFGKYPKLKSMLSYRVLRKP